MRDIRIQFCPWCRFMTFKDPRHRVWGVGFDRWLVSLRLGHQRIMLYWGPQS